ncbi:MAG: DUF1513 domain-containing protein [Pseudomonadota bacterium]
MATRRELLKSVALGLGAAVCNAPSAQPAERSTYVGVETSAETGLSRAVFFAGSGERNGSINLNYRAHGFAQHGNKLVVFPRRPGNKFAIVDLANLEIKNVVTAPAERHFYGHGAFSIDGKHLLVTENDLHNLQGSIGVYDTTGSARRLGQIDLPTPGPHEIVRSVQGDRFFIALGGLQTHPDYGRTPLNLAEFRSQTVVLDFKTSDVERMGFWPGTEGVSLRHLAQDTAGRLYIGGQEISKTRKHASDALWLVDGSRVEAINLGGMLGGYVSSVASHGRVALVSSKKSGIVAKFEEGRLLDKFRCDGASAVAVSSKLLAISGFSVLQLGRLEVSPPARHEFDNHGAIIGCSAA